MKKWVNITVKVEVGRDCELTILSRRQFENHDSSFGKYVAIDDEMSPLEYYHIQKPSNNTWPRHEKLSVAFLLFPWIFAKPFIFDN